MLANAFNGPLARGPFGVGPVVHVPDTREAYADTRTCPFGNFSSEGREKAFYVRPWQVRPSRPGEDGFKGSAMLRVHGWMVLGFGTKRKGKMVGGCSGLRIARWLLVGIAEIESRNLLSRNQLGNNNRVESYPC